MIRRPIQGLLYISIMMLVHAIGVTQQPQTPGTPPDILASSDLLLRPPYFTNPPISRNPYDQPGRLDSELWGRTTGIYFTTGKFLIWSGNDFNQVGGGFWLWDPSTSRCESIPFKLNLPQQNQHLSFNGSQVLVDGKPTGSLVRFDPLKQAWVNEVPAEFTWVAPRSSWPQRIIPGGWILQQDPTSGGAHAWEVIDPKTGIKKQISGTPLQGREICRSDGRIILLSGKQSQILDPQTGSLVSGPPIQLSGWGEVCVLPGDKVLFAGGSAQTKPIPKEVEGELDGYEAYFEPIRGLYQMDLHTFKVNRVAVLRFDRIEGFTMIPTPDGKLLIAGGTRGYGPNGKSPVPEIEYLDLKTYKDTVRFRLLADYTNGLMRELKDGKVILVGGTVGGGITRKLASIPAPPELFDPISGISVPLKPMAEGFGVIQILEDGAILLYDLKAAGTYPKPPTWPISLQLFNPFTGQTKPAGELTSTHPRNCLLVPKDRILFSAPNNLNIVEDSATSLELWDPEKGSVSLKIDPFRYLQPVCGLKDGRLLLQAIGPGEGLHIQTYLLNPIIPEIRQTKNPRIASNSTFGYQLRDGRVLLNRGWVYNNKMRKGYYFMDQVWDPISEKYYQWPQEFLDPVEDKTGITKHVIPKVSLQELSFALGVTENNPDPEVISAMIGRRNQSRSRTVLKDGRVLFLEASGVSFYPGREKPKLNPQP